MLERVLNNWLAAVPLRRRVLGLLAEHGAAAYLVGGTIRDALLGRASCDIDVAVAGQAMALARHMADCLHGAYVPLDATRDVARVVLQGEDGSHHVDLASLRGADIEADLWGRDYTVNALAVPVSGPWVAPIDPTGGQADLLARLLRVVSPLAFQDDPLRILRGIRLWASLGFALTHETEALMRTWLPQLGRVSGERVRDELLSLLACDASSSALRYGQKLGAFQVVLPPSISADSLTRGARAVAVLEGHALWRGPTASATADDDLSSILRTFDAPLRAHWSEELASGHQRWLLLKLATWLGCVGWSCGEHPALLASELMRRLRLSVREGRYLSAALEGASALSAWADDLEPRPLDAYRYYRRTGDAGVDGAILAVLGEMVSTGAASDQASVVSGQQASPGRLIPSPRRRIAAHLGYLLEAWFERRASWVSPPTIVTGYDLSSALGIAPGPEMGQWLERVREAQVQGLVRTKEDALSYIEAWPT